MPDTPKILIVEDDPSFREFLTLLLGGQGYEPHTADSGRKAIAFLKFCVVDLVILDIGLPDMDGYEVLDNVREQCPTIPVIAMTGYSSVESAVDSLKRGAYDYLEKPFKSDKLLKTVENALARSRLERERQQAEERLLESEDKYHQLFDAISDALMVFDAETLQFENANHAALKLYGYSREEFLNLSVLDISAEKAKTISNVTSLKNAEPPSKFVPLRYFKKKDGTVFPGEIGATTVISGNRKKLIGAVRDITDRHKAENELRRTKKKLQHVLTSSPAVIYSANPLDNFRATFISENVKMLLGYESQEFLDTADFWSDHIHPGDRPHVVHGLSDLSARKKFAFEYRLLHKNGSYRWMRDEFRLICDKHGTPVELVGFLLDITDRRRAEEALRASEQEFRDLVENSLIGISIIQGNRFVYKNPIQLKMYGSSKNKTIHEHIKSIHPDDADKAEAIYKSIMAGDAAAADGEIRFYPTGDIDNSGDLRWAHCSITPFKYRGKDAILLNVVDITKTKQLEQQLIIKNKMISLGRVAAGIAHEIRNPLTGINSYLYTLEDLCCAECIEPDDLQMMQQILNQIQVASNKIESVIKRVMDFSKPGAPQMVLTDINQPIDEAIKLSAVTMRKNGIDIEKSLARDLPRCYADPQLIEQVIMNLINNAAKAMAKTDGSKKVEIKVLSQNNTLSIRVADSGPGVPLKLRDKIFDPFFTTNEDGSGIGLNIAQRIIADHNGSISLDTSKWGGAEFKIDLPIERRIIPR